MAEKLCPLLKKPCIEHDCRWFVHLLGRDPQTGKEKDDWGCTIEYLPVLLIENAHQTRQFAGAAESARNAARVDTEMLVRAIGDAANQRLLRG